MAKFYGSIVKVGKVGGSVFRVRGGVTVESQYQPNVFNPQTTKQIEARAKLKMMSQLSEVFAPVIAIPRRGLVSPRNTFTSLNYKAMSYANDQASVNMTSLKITDSVLSLPAVSATRSSSVVNVALTGTADIALEGVVYSQVAVADDGTLRLVDTKVVTQAGQQRNFPTTMTLVGANSYVYAYGYRGNEAIRHYYGDVNVVTAEQIARLIVTNAEGFSSMTVTETRATAAVNE